MNRQDQEVRDGCSIERIWNKIIYCTKEQNLESAAGATAVLWYPAIFLGPRFLVSWFPRWLPGSRFFVFCLWCCSESEDSANLLRIQHSNSLCSLVLLFLYIEFISGLVAIHSVLSQFVFAHLAKEQAFPVRQILFRGAVAPTLLPVRPGPHLIDVGLL